MPTAASCLSKVLWVPLKRVDGAAAELRARPGDGRLNGDAARRADRGAEAPVELVDEGGRRVHSSKVMTVDLP